MRDYEKITFEIEELKEQRNKLPRNERKELSERIRKLREVIRSHERYTPVDVKFKDSFAIKTFGKNYRELNAEELKEYNKLRKRISRQK